MNRFRYKIVKTITKYEEYYEVYERVLGFLWWKKWKGWRCGKYEEAVHCILLSKITYAEINKEDEK